MVLLIWTTALPSQGIYQLDIAQSAPAVYKLRREFYANCASDPRFKHDQHFEAELVPFATHEVGHARLCDAQPLGRLSLSELLLLDVAAKITHEVCAHLEHGGFGLVKAKINKNVAAGFGCFLALLHFRSSLNAIACEPLQ